MHREPVALATSIVRNSVALMAVGLLAKGMGLVLAVLIARFLGPRPWACSRCSSASPS